MTDIAIDERLTALDAKVSELFRIMEGLRADVQFLLSRNR